MISLQRPEGTRGDTQIQVFQCQLISLFTFFGVKCVKLKGNSVEEMISVDFRKISCKFRLVKQNFLDLDK